MKSFVQGFHPTSFGRRILFEQIIYGDDPANGLPPLQRSRANLLGKPYQQFDGAGVVTNVQYDFKGNLLNGTRQLARDYKREIDWSQAPTRQSEFFTSETKYDALNRPVAVVSPHTAAMTASVTKPVYNEGGLLNSIDVSVSGTWRVSYVKNIDYDEKGQRTKIEYGNGAITDYTYDPETFRLIRLTTTRDHTFPANERVVQDLQYTYDPVGNITHIQDDADIQNVVFFNNRRIDPSANYRYDAIYRLIEADGREHIGQVGQPETSWDDKFRVKLTPHPHDGLLMRQYVERYVYDEVGNIEELVHLNGRLATPGQAIWRRRYTYTEPSLIEDGAPGNPLRKSNRLTQTMVGRSVPGQLLPETYPHDQHGNITGMSHLQMMEWNFKDQLRHIQQGTLHAYYVYDASGQRTRKVVEKNNGSLIEERIYLGGFEIYREHKGSIGSTTASLERETFHIMDDKRRVAIIETKTFPKPPPGPVLQLTTRYQFGNHLGSASLELDEQENVISYEEYHPYGTTSYQAGPNRAEVSLKRYRYTGKEKDEVSGFYYHAARYYFPWLGRWATIDPAPKSLSASTYSYCDNSPICLIDPSGKAGIKTGVPESTFLYSLDHLIAQANAGHDPKLLVSAKNLMLLPQSDNFSKQDLGDVHLAPRGTVSLAEAKKQGPGAFSRAAQQMMQGSLGDTEEMNTLWQRASKNETNTYETSRTNFYERLRTDKSPEGELAREALAQGNIGFDQETGLPKLDKAKALGVSEQTQKTMEGQRRNPTPRMMRGIVEKALTTVKQKTITTAKAAVAGAKVAVKSFIPGSEFYDEAKSVGGGSANLGARVMFQAAKEMGSQAVQTIQRHGRQLLTAAAGSAFAVKTIASSMTAAVSTSATAAFSATSLAGIGTAGAGAVGVAGTAVLVAGAVGYGLGTVINKALVEPLMDKLAPGSGALGDWYYRTFLK